jgi:hypothetical protein
MAELTNHRQLMALIGLGPVGKRVCQGREDHLLIRPDQCKVNGLGQSLAQGKVLCLCADETGLTGCSRADVVKQQLLEFRSE